MTTLPRTSRLLSLACACALFLPLAGQAGTFQVTGQNGGTMDGTWTCQSLNGQWVCNSQSVVTGPQGGSGTRSRSTALSQGTLTSVLSGTRIGGRTFGRTTTISR